MIEFKTEINREVESLQFFQKKLEKALDSKLDRNDA